MSKLITFALNGDISIQSFAEAVKHFRSLVEQLSSSVAKGEPIDWRVEVLEASSAFVGVGGYGEALAVDRVVTEYIRLGEDAQRGDLTPYPREIVGSVVDLVGLMNGQVESIRFETEESDALLTHDAKDAITAHKPLVGQKPPTYKAWGAVDGYIQTLSQRSEYRFTLYDALFDKAVSCYMSASDEEKMRGMWGKRAMVEGMVTRDSGSGRPLSVRQISSVVLVDEREEGAWRSARGVSPSVSGELPEVALRRARDDQ